VLGTTEAHEAVPPEAGAISTRVDVLAESLQRLVNDPEEARARRDLARAHVLSRYGLERFLSDWDELLVPAEVAP
jgi:hypothetical protein